jgi:hypothetical protein
LPPACPGGQYHPYPIGHPQQDLCIPFPVSSPGPAPTGSAGGASGGSGGSAPQAPKPPTPPPQQPATCPPGQYKSPSTGTCLPIPRCVPGSVFDARSERCIPYGQSQQPLCPTGYWPNYSTQRCEVIPSCTTPGTVFDMTKGICVPASQVTPTQPQSEMSSLFSDLQNVPWWVYAALVGILLFGSKESEGRVTTVKYRRSK